MIARKDKEHVRVTQESVTDPEENPGFLVPSLALLLDTTLLHLFSHSLYCIETLIVPDSVLDTIIITLWRFSSVTCRGDSPCWIMVFCLWISVPITLADRLVHLAGLCQYSHSSIPQVGFFMLYSQTASELVRPTENNTHRGTSPEEKTMWVQHLKHKWVQNFPST